MLAELALPPGAHILEIGCGWGGFAEVAARAGYRVTGLSLSDAQTAYARERIARAGLADRVTLSVRDYRDERGTYDGVASIEMFEAVGEKYWPAYFSTLRRCLAPGGRACVQTITIADDRFERYRTQSDFIQQYIFPGGMLASPSRFVAHAAQAGLDVAANAHVRPGLRGNAGPLARSVRRQRGRGARAGLRREIHPLLAVLSRVLHRGLCERVDRCRAIHPRRALTARGHWPARSPQVSPSLRAPAT